MPVGDQTDARKKFKVKLEGEVNECKKTESILGELGDHNRHGLDELVCDAVEGVARNLSWGGRAVYEIIDTGDEVHVYGFTSKNLTQVLFHYLQIIPPGDWGLFKRKFSWITGKKIWKIEIPKVLGGAKNYRKILSEFKKYKLMFPVFHMKDIAQGEMTAGFNVREYTRNGYIHLNRASKDWGWNRRDVSEDNCTEYYLCYKKLKFRCAQAKLREHIICEINKLLARLNINCKVIVSGLPTPEEIVNLIDDLDKGKISFTKAYDRTSM